MKRSVVFFGLVLGAVAGLAAQSVSLTNTFGGNSDNVGTSDFLKFANDGTKVTAIVGDRVQLDFASEHIDSRVRLNVSGDAGYIPSVQGYVNFRPFDWLNVIGGNKFFWKWTTSGAYLGAIDDYLVHGKLADDNGAGVVLNFTSKEKDFGVTVAGAFGSISRLDLNFGAQFFLKDAFVVGVTAQDVTEKSFSLGGYFGLNLVKNLLFNVGYTYNNVDATYIQATQNLIQASTGYKFEDIGLELYGDFLIGLNNRSSYNAATDAYDELAQGIPVYSKVRAHYVLNDYFDLNGAFTVNHSLTADSSLTSFTVYPYFDYKTKKAGTFRAGVRVFFDDATGYKGLNIPFSWQYKIAATF